MYSAEAIKNMSDDAARAEFDELAATYYQSTRWKTAFAKDVGLTSQTVQQWFTDRSRPPVWAFQLVHYRKQATDLSTKIRSIKSALKGIPDLA